LADKNVHDGHRKRLRDRAMREGLTNFDPHQVVEMLLFYAVSRQDTSEMAHHLINRFGSVNAVLKAPIDELTEIPGVGKKVAQWLKDLGSLVENYSDLCAADRVKIVNYRTAVEFCERMRSACEAPCTYQICTTPSGTIQSFSKISDSVEWSDAEVLRTSLRNALSVKARSVLIVEFQDRDQPVEDEYHLPGAEKYARTLDTMNAELLDVLLVGRSQVVSMMREGRYDKTAYGQNLSVVAENYLREETEQIGYGDDLPEFEHGL